MSQVAIQLDPEDRRSFRRFIAASAVLHAAGFAALAFTPTLPSSFEVPAAISVNLVAAPSPGPAPAPRAAPKPRPPKPAPVVLPAEPSLPKPRPAPKPARPEPEPLPEPELPAEHDYTDVMASLRAEAGEETPETVEEPTPAPAVGPSGGGPGTPVSAEVRAWMTAARIRIKDNWVVPPSFRMAAIAAEVRLDVDASGAVEPHLVAGSGNPYYDDGVLRSIRKADPLPPPPEPGEWTFRFVSDDY